MNEKLKKSSIRRDLCIAALIGFTAAAILFTLAVITMAAVQHSTQCSIH